MTTPNRTVIDPNGKLDDLIAALVQHDHAVTLLRGGLRLTWDRDGTQAIFAASRHWKDAGDKLPSITEQRVIVQHAAPYLDLQALPKTYEEIVRRDGTDIEATWKGVRWLLTVEVIPL